MHGLHDEREIFFCKLTKNGYLYTDQSCHESVRTFPTDSMAQKYIQKYKNRLSGFTVKRIVNTGGLTTGEGSTF